MSIKRFQVCECNAGPNYKTRAPVAIKIFIFIRQPTNVIRRRIFCPILFLDLCSFLSSKTRLDSLEEETAPPFQEKNPCKSQNAYSQSMPSTKTTLEVWQFFPFLQKKWSGSPICKLKQPLKWSLPETPVNRFISF